MLSAQIESSADPISRLAPGALHVLSLSNAERIEYVRKDKFINYTAADDISKDLAELLEHPARNRMPCRLIVADTNNGKTNLVRHFVSQHPADLNEDGPTIRLPVLHIEIVEPDERHLYLELLKALFQAFPPKASSAERREQLISILKQVRPKIIIIDEINTMINGSIAKQRACLNALKHITNEVGVPIVGAGTREALMAFRTDPQMENRFEPRWLPSWRNDDELKRLLTSFEQFIPLRFPSDLWKKEMRSAILHRAGGTIGEMAKLIEAATIHAIRLSTEQITVDVLNSCSYVSPSGRRLVPSAS